MLKFFYSNYEFVADKHPKWEDEDVADMVEWKIPVTVLELPETRGSSSHSKNTQELYSISGIHKHWPPLFSPSPPQAPKI